MTKVPDRELSKGELFNQHHKSKPVLLLNGQEKQESRYWRYKKNKPPKDVYKPKRTKIKDKRLISEQVAHQNHIRSIRNEL